MYITNKNKCAVQGMNGDCPNPTTVTITTNDGIVYPCDDCHKNVLAGAYGEKLAKASFEIKHPSQRQE